MTNKMSKELTKEKGQKEILSECLLGVDKTVLKLGHYIGIYSAMQEYSYQNTKPLIDEISINKKRISELQDLVINLTEQRDLKDREQDRYTRLYLESEAKLKASKSEANEAVYTESQVSDLIETICYRLRSGFFKSLDLKHKSIDRIKNEDYTSWKNEIFKTRNNK